MLSAPAAATTKDVSKDVSEHVAKDITDIVDIHVRIVMHAESAQSVMAELVIAFAFFRIAENLIRLSAFLELGFRFFVTGIFVGMIFDGQLAIFTLDIISRAPFVHSQNFVIIPLGHIKSLLGPKGRQYSSRGRKPPVFGS